MRMRWLREREMSMTMMSMYIISSWGEHPQEAKDGIVCHDNRNDLAIPKSLMFQVGTY